MEVFDISPFTLSIFSQLGWFRFWSFKTLNFSYQVLVFPIGESMSSMRL